jgi:hypothetical protein
MPRLLGEGGPKLPSPLDAVRNSSTESSIMTHCGVDAPLQVELMKAAPAAPLLGERHRPLKQSVMNSKFPRRTVSPRENPPHIKHSPSAAMMIADEGTIRACRGKLRCKSIFLAHQLSMFFAPARYMVVKIVHSYSDVVSRTTKHTMVYPGSAPSLEVIALCPTV